MDDEHKGPAYVEMIDAMDSAIEVITGKKGELEEEDLKKLLHESLDHMKTAVVRKHEEVIRALPMKRLNELHEYFRKLKIPRGMKKDRIENFPIAEDYQRISNKILAVLRKVKEIEGHINAATEEKLSVYDDRLEEIRIIIFEALTRIERIIERYIKIRKTDLVKLDPLTDSPEDNDNKLKQLLEFELETLKETRYFFKAGIPAVENVHGNIGDRLKAVEKGASELNRVKTNIDIIIKTELYLADKENEYPLKVGTTLDEEGNDTNNTPDPDAITKALEKFRTDILELLDRKLQKPDNGKSQTPGGDPSTGTPTSPPGTPTAGQGAVAGAGGVVNNIFAAPGTIAPERMPDLIKDMEKKIEEVEVKVNLEAHQIHISYDQIHNKLKTLGDHLVLLATLSEANQKLAIATQEAVHKFEFTYLDRKEQILQHIDHEIGHNKFQTVLRQINGIKGMTLPQKVKHLKERLQGRVALMNSDDPILSIMINPVNKWKIFLQIMSPNLKKINENLKSLTKAELECIQVWDDYTKLIEAEPKELYKIEVSISAILSKFHQEVETLPEIFRKDVGYEAAKISRMLKNLHYLILQPSQQEFEACKTAWDTILKTHFHANKGGVRELIQMVKVHEVQMKRISGRISKNTQTEEDFEKDLIKDKYVIRTENGGLELVLLRYLLHRTQRMCRIYYPIITSAQEKIIKEAIVRRDQYLVDYEGKYKIIYFDLERLKKRIEGLLAMSK